MGRTVDSCIIAVEPLVNKMSLFCIVHLLG
jgi:hypothetical protein